MSCAVNQGSDDEPDFMSDEFLAECTKHDVRPGLLFKHQDKRKHQLLKKRSEANQSTQEKIKANKMLEETNREAGLRREIGSENKGFNMLVRMGFKPGTSIGKIGNEGIKAPIPVQIKKGRGCIGEERVVREKRKKFEETVDPEAFRARLLASSASRNIMNDLYKAQTVCRNLDSSKGSTEPLLPWYWPKPEKKKKLEDEESANSSDSEEDEITPQPNEQLETLVEHLRVTYFYCIWCGTSYDGTEDLKESCPGKSREDH